MIVVSTGCPAGVGPEISVAAAATTKKPIVLVGDLQTLRAAAQLVGVAPERLVPFSSARTRRGQIPVLAAGPVLEPKDRRPGKPNRTAGVAQLAYIDAAFDLVKSLGTGAALVTAPVSKSVIHDSGAKGASRFLGHTEWLEHRDRAAYTVMCFGAECFSTSLVTTHLPIKDVARALTAEKVARSTVALSELLLGLGAKKPVVAICSLNPHAGESSLLGHEEARAIEPGIQLARRSLKRRVTLVGPVGAETAYRKAASGVYQGVVAMYHDQATIPMKLVAFGDAVNVTWGLSVIRTSVDHGTGYDIAWTGKANPQGMHSAIAMAEALGRAR